jgi:ribonucleoside-diphosphate reductase alpha chain
MRSCSRADAAPKQPAWFNTASMAYGIAARRGTSTSILETKALTSRPAYEHPQPHACFIQSVADDLGERRRHHGPVYPRGASLQYGSGTGTNFSSLRGVTSARGRGPLSGLMSFLKIGDRAAGAIKSGGTTRRAAKMVICDMTTRHRGLHQLEGPEEQKVAPRRRLQVPRSQAQRDLRAIRGWTAPKRPPRPQGQPALKSAIRAARRR